jgi:hypothetical protein
MIENYFWNRNRRFYINSNRHTTLKKITPQKRKPLNCIGLPKGLFRAEWGWTSVGQAGRLLLWVLEPRRDRGFAVLGRRNGRGPGGKSDGELGAFGVSGGDDGSTSSAGSKRCVCQVADPIESVQGGVVLPAVEVWGWAACLREMRVPPLLAPYEEDARDPGIATSACYKLIHVNTPAQVFQLGLYFLLGFSAVKFCTWFRIAGFFSLLHTCEDFCVELFSSFSIAPTYRPIHISCSYSQSLRSPLFLSAFLRVSCSKDCALLEYFSAFSPFSTCFCERNLISLFWHC